MECRVSINYTVVFNDTVQEQEKMQPQQEEQWVWTPLEWEHVSTQQKDLERDIQKRSDILFPKSFYQ